jgi:hypothetical protein
MVTVTNDFDDPIYSYRYPAHYAYDAMGPAYKNIGIQFTASLTSTTNTPGSPLYALASGPDTTVTNRFVPGDEFYINDGTNEFYVQFVRQNGTTLFFSNPSGISVAAQKFILVRSGRRNMLSADAGNIKTLGKKGSTLGDPTKNRY